MSTLMLLPARSLYAAMILDVCIMMIGSVEPTVGLEGLNSPDTRSSSGCVKDT